MSMRLNISQNNKPEWLSTRRKYVTASEAGVICFPSSYANAVDVFQEKTSRIEHEDFQNDDMIRGSIMESFLIRKIEKAFPEIGELERNQWLYVEELDGLFSATPDAFLTDNQGKNIAAIEVKCPRRLPNEKTRYGKEKRLRYLIQLWVGMRCSGVTLGTLCVGQAPYGEKDISMEDFHITSLDNLFLKYVPLLEEFRADFTRGILSRKFW